MTIGKPGPREELADALQSLGHGRQAELERIYRLTSAKLFGICLRILDDRHEAEEVLQEVYLNVWRKAGRFDPARASPITWLAVLARNRAIDRLRSRRGARVQEPVDVAADVPDPAESALAGLERAEEGSRLQNCVEALGSRQSAAIRSAFFEGFSYSELAARSGVPLGTMKSLIRRGLIQLRECLGR